MKTPEYQVKNDIDAIVDDLLSRWHSWRNGYTYGRGYRSTDATSRDAQSSYHYRDRDSGVVDAYIEGEIMKAVDRAVDCIAEPWHLVILIEARNLSSGFAVWSSVRLPPGEELEIMRIEARSKLLNELQRQGCIGG